MLFYVIQVAAHGAARLVGIAFGNGGKDGLVVFERLCLVTVEGDALNRNGTNMSTVLSIMVRRRRRARSGTLIRLTNGALN